MLWLTCRQALSFLCFEGISLLVNILVSSLSSHSRVNLLTDLTFPTLIHPEAAVSDKQICVLTIASCVLCNAL